MSSAFHPVESVRARWSGLSVRAKSLVVIAIPLVTLALVIVAFLVVESQLEQARQDVTDTIEVRAELVAVQSLVVDLETGVRGYLLTDDRQYLEPYDAARLAIPATMERLAELVARDAVQADRAAALGRLVDERLIVAERTLALAATGTEPQLLEELAVGRQGSDAVRALVKEMDDAQADRVASARRLTDRADTRWQIALWAAVAVGLVGGVFVAWGFTRGVARRLRLLGEDAEALGAGSLPQGAYAGSDDIDQVGRAVRQAAEELAARAAIALERESRLQAVLDASPDAILVLDADTTVWSASPAVQSMLGYPSVQRIGHKALDLMHPDDAPAFEAWIGRLARGEQAESRLRYRLRHHGGHWVSIEARGRRLPGVGGEPDRVLIVSRDVTIQAQLDDARRQATKAARDANRAKSEFLSRMSHELRTPLNAVLGFAQLLELDDLREDQAQAVNHILRGGRHLLDLVNEVLDVSRIEAGTLSMSPEPVLVGDVVGESVDLVRSLADERGVALVASAASCEEFVMADRQRLRQVLLNLLSNAIKYNRPQGSVTIGCRADGSTVAITVTDTGLGIPAEQQDRLFVPFDRLGAEQQGIEGTGMGLSLARRLAEAMWGRLELESSSSSGSTFVVVVPRVDGPPDAATPDARPGQRRAGGPIDPPDGEHGGTVVQIEDNPANIKLVQHVLSRRPNVRVIPAMQGRLGIDLVRQEAPDLVLLDLHLPDIDGQTVLQTLRSDPDTASTPIVVLSADATPGQIRRILAGGADAYLTKPFDIGELLAIVDRYVGRHRPS